MRSVVHIIARILIEAELKRVQAKEQPDVEERSKHDDTLPRPVRTKDAPQDVPGQQ